MIAFHHRLYVAGFVICPVLFYLPKFFEIRTTSMVHTRIHTLNCSNLRLFTPDQLPAIMEIGAAINGNILEKDSIMYVRALFVGPLRSLQRPGADLHN